MGVDPGKEGAVAIISPTETTYFSHKDVKLLPEMGIFDAQDYYDKLPSIYGDRLVVVIERVIVRSAQRGAVLMAANYGVCLSALTMAYDGDSIYQVTPMVWKAAVLGEGKHTKDDSIELAESLGFEIPTKRPKGRVKDDNVAEACLLAWYAKEFLDDSR